MNGALIAAGGLAVRHSLPMRALAAMNPIADDSCDGAIGDDPRVLRGGNLKRTFKVAHWLRDQRLTFIARSQL